MKTDVFTKTRDFFINYFSLSGQLVSQQEAEANIREGVSFRGTNALVLIMAILIASLGLNTNSTAVIIGAMLISPLMGPIIGLGLGVGIHDFSLIKRCMRNLIMAAGISVLASTFFFLISPVNEQHSELLARTSPTIYDVLIGFVGGAAGIIALGSTNKGNVIPGVAIATALMPPLCTAGYGLATWQLNYFLGASYLFIINSIYIAFATFIGVKLMKYKGTTSADPVRQQKVMKTVYTLAVLTMLPSIYLTYNMLRENKFNMRVQNFVQNECRFPDTQVLTSKASMAHGNKTLKLTLIGRHLPSDSLCLALSSRLQYYGLKGTHIDIFQGSDIAYNTSAKKDDAIFQLAQKTISRQQFQIDSLKALVDDARRNSAIEAPRIANEVKVIFPQVDRIGISKAVFSNLKNGTADTASVVMVYQRGRMNRAETEKLAKYVEARLGLKKVQIVPLPAD